MLISDFILGIYIGKKERKEKQSGAPFDQSIFKCAVWMTLF